MIVGLGCVLAHPGVDLKVQGCVVRGVCCVVSAAWCVVRGEERLWRDV